MVTTDRIGVERDLVWWKCCSLVYCEANTFFPAGFRSQSSLSSQCEHHSTSWSCQDLEIHMKQSHVNRFQVLILFESSKGPFTYCIEISYIKSIVVFGSWLGSCSKQCNYLAISHTNIEILMEWSQRTGFRWKEIQFD